MYTEKSVNEAIKLAIKTNEPVKVNGRSSNIIIMSEETFIIIKENQKDKENKRKVSAKQNQKRIYHNKYIDDVYNY